MNDIERRLTDLGDRVAQEVTYHEVPRRRIVRRARARRAAIVAGPAAAVVLFAAVAYPRLGSDGNRGMPVSVDLAAAAEATEDAGSARIAMSMTMELGGRTTTMKSEGEVDFGDSRSYFRMTGGGAYGMPGEFEMISIGTTMFQRAVGDPRWVKSEVDPPAGGAPLGAGPDDFLAYLEAVSEDVTSLGEEVLDGVPVTHLRATLDTAALEDMTAMTATGYEYEPFHVWIDEANRVRKMTFGASYEGDGALSSGTVSITTRFWDFGLAVDVEAPPPEDVTDEPPAGWGGEGSELIGVESGDDGSGGVTMIMGERDVEAPYVEVDTEDPSFVEVCAYSTRSVTSATLVHRPSGRLVLLFDPVRSDGHFEGPHQVACVDHRFTRADVDALIEDPSEFRLTVTRKDGSSEVVELSQIASSLEGDVAGE